MRNKDFMIAVLDIGEAYNVLWREGILYKEGTILIRRRMDGLENF